MKPLYSDLSYRTGLHKAGIKHLQITPREWLAEDPAIDFATGQVLNTPTLKEGKFWLLLQLTRKSYEFNEVPEGSKSGDFYKITVGGLLNTSNAAIQQVLETIRYSELVMIVNSKYDSKRKIIGNTQMGLRMRITHTEKNAPDSEEKVQLDFIAETEGLSPYYNPDNASLEYGNFLINNDGDYLLVE